VTQHRVIRCAVCRELQAAPDGWFHITENRWTDRLKVFRFQEALANQAAYSVCCAAHVRELVVHWMTTGRLDFPFARLPFSPRHIPAQSATQQRLNSPAVPLSSALGELAIHRETLTRILRHNPQALSALVEALILAIDPDHHHPPALAATNLQGIRVEGPVAM
jgi:hypothetical protein